MFMLFKSHRSNDQLLTVLAEVRTHIVFPKVALPAGVCLDDHGCGFGLGHRHQARLPALKVLETATGTLFLFFNYFLKA